MRTSQPRINAAERKKRCYHEAGHVVVAHILKWRILRLALNDCQFEHCEYCPGHIETAPGRLICHRMVISRSGVLANSFAGQTPDHDQQKEDAKDFKIHFEELIKRRDQRSSRKERYEERADALASEMLQRSEPLLRALASALRKKSIHERRYGIEEKYRPSHRCDLSGRSIRDIILEHSDYVELDDQQLDCILRAHSRV